MEQARNINAKRTRLGFAIPVFELTATLLVFAAYTLTLWVARSLTLGEAAVGAAMNTLSVMIFGLAARRIIMTRLAGEGLALQVAGHAMLAMAFSLLAYWLLLVLLGLVAGASATEFDVRPFASRAMAWQLLENVTVYAVVAALSHLHARPDSVTVILSDRAAMPEGREGLSRYFIRTGDDILPVDVTRIVSIAGADDYAEITTLDGTHLVRMTLAEFERALDSRKFIRVHRSRIVNVERIARAEPAGGGRILLHMENGEMIPASRSGSKLLRDRVL